MMQRSKHMQDIAPELIERYQILLQQDPKSQVFAPLTEAYRKMGLLEEAFRIAVRGVQFNPSFAGGRIALAKVFLDRDSLKSATDELEKAVECSAENIMAHSLLADCYLKAKRPKEALRAFKMVLFLAPTNEKAMKAVKKLEALTADEYEDDLFQMKPLPNIEYLQTEKALPLRPIESAAGRELERTLSLVDAFIVRNDNEKALKTLRDVEAYFGNHPEIIKRMKLINQRTLNVEETAPPEPPPSRARDLKADKIEILRSLLDRVSRNSRLLQT